MLADNEPVCFKRLERLYGGLFLHLKGGASFTFVVLRHLQENRVIPIKGSMYTKKTFKP